MNKLLIVFSFTALFAGCNKPVHQSAVKKEEVAIRSWPCQGQMMIRATNSAHSHSNDGPSVLESGAVAVGHTTVETIVCNSKSDCPEERSQHRVEHEPVVIARCSNFVTEAVTK